MKGTNKRLLVVLWAVWLLLIGGGYVAVVLYAETEGDIRSPREERVEKSAVPYDSLKTVVYFFLHPDCPCSVASMKEFADVLHYLPPKALLCPVFLMPPDKGEQERWRNSSLYQAALSLPDAFMYEDIEGAEMEKWRAKTSGLVVILGGGGKVIFWGGITQNRGYIGDNRNKFALIEALQTSAVHLTTAPVYGCGLTTQNTCQ